ncbi:MAG TPA: hypothetical protein VF599_01075 [Pyrinomonadaceae bacterium]
MQTQLTAEFDKIIPSEFKPEEPGGAVLIAQKRRIIYKKAFSSSPLGRTDKPIPARP